MLVAQLRASAARSPTRRRLTLSAPERNPTTPHETQPGPTPALTVGGVVVYRSHGVGRIVDVQAATPDSPGFAVLELGDGLTVTLSLEQAGALLRAPASEDQLREVQGILGDDPVDDPGSWPTRLRAMQQKVAAGELTGLAEVTRDGIKDDRKRGGRGGSTLPPSQRALCLKARRLLATEIAAVRNIDTEQADAWIVAQCNA